MTVPSVALVTSDRCLLHEPPAGHVERSDRLRAVVNRLTAAGMQAAGVRVEALPAGDGVLERVHTREHIARMRDICSRGGGLLDDGDTFAVFQPMRQVFEIVHRHSLCKIIRHIYINCKFSCSFDFDNNIDD